MRQPFLIITSAHIRLVTDHVISPTNVRSIIESRLTQMSFDDSSSRTVLRQRAAEAVTHLEVEQLLRDALLEGGRVLARGLDDLLAAGEHGWGKEI